MNQKESRWQTQDLSKAYLEGIRGAIPSAQTQISVMLKIIRSWSPDPERVIDLGCGDGILGRAILNSFPHVQVFFVDFSEPMLKAARKAFQKNPLARVIKADFSTPDWLAALEGQRDFNMVISGFSIHHQTDKRKRKLYSEIHELLAPGGVFLNLEHVASRTEAIAEIFDDYFIDHLHAFHKGSGSTVSRRKIAEKYYRRPDKTENILAPVEIQCGWLREIGFEDVDCFFKEFELALFGGRKAI